MNRDTLIDAGAFALYEAENAHRIVEFEKAANANDLIAEDFAKFRGRYVRMFRDLHACLERQGLTVRRAG